MMLSRIADSMFWLNRYMERADGLTRALRYFYILGFDKYEEDNSDYGPLLQCFTSLPEASLEAMRHDGQAVLCFLITDTSNVNSLKVLVGKARENARGSQDKITKEVWEQVNAMYHYINNDGLQAKLKGEEPLKVLDQLERHCLMYAGIIDSTMPRGMGWQFMNLGKFIERCLQSVDMIDAYLRPIDYDLEQKDDLLYWRRLLFSLSGYELYLKSNRGTHHTRQVMNGVVFNANFPRSIFYCLARMDKYLHGLLEENPAINGTALQKKFGRLKSMVEFTDPSQMTGEELRKMLIQIREQVWSFSADLSRLFFNYT